MKGIYNKRLVTNVKSTVWSAVDLILALSVRMKRMSWLMEFVSYSVWKESIWKMEGVRIVLEPV